MKIDSSKEKYVGGEIAVCCSRLDSVSGALNIYDLKFPLKFHALNEFFNLFFLKS